MTTNILVALVVLLMVGLFIGADSYHRTHPETYEVKLYGADGQLVQQWVGTELGTHGGIAFFNVSGREVQVSGTFVVRRLK